MKIICLEEREPFGMCLIKLKRNFHCSFCKASVGHIRHNKNYWIVFFFSK